MTTTSRICPKDIGTASQIGKLSLTIRTLAVPIMIPVGPCVMISPSSSWALYLRASRQGNLPLRVRNLVHHLESRVDSVGAPGWTVSTVENSGEVPRPLTMDPRLTVSSVVAPSFTINPLNQLPGVVDLPPVDRHYGISRPQSGLQRRRAGSDSADHHGPDERYLEES